MPFSFSLTDFHTCFNIQFRSHLIWESVCWPGMSLVWMAGSSVAQKALATAWLLWPTTDVISLVLAPYQLSEGRVHIFNFGFHGTKHSSWKMDKTWCTLWTAHHLPHLVQMQWPIFKKFSRARSAWVAQWLSLQLLVSALGVILGFWIKPHVGLP